MEQLLISRVQDLQAFKGKVSHYTTFHLSGMRRSCDASGAPHPERLVTPHGERLREAALLFMREKSRCSDLSHSPAETSNRLDIMDPKESPATEQTEEKKVLQLAELLTHRSLIDTMPRPPAPAQIELKVIQSAIMDYTYKWQGKEVHTQKLQIVLQSKIAEQYCLGVAKLQKKDRTELKNMADRWQVDSTWRFTNLALHSDKPAYIHTPCRIAIDLRKTKAEKLLQSVSYPPTPVPTVTIADVLGLKQMQRFDLMAIAATIIDARKSGAGVHIADVRLVDGTKQNDSNTTEYASLPLTLFFQR